MKKGNKRSGLRGFTYFRTMAQIVEYLKVPPMRKLQWLEEMYQFNRRVAESNPIIGAIQNKFRRGEI